MHYAVQAIAQIGGMQKVTRPMPTTDRVQRATVALQMAEFATNVGRRLKQLREERKARDPRWTQDYAARQIREDLTGAQYARWERGEVLPREETIERTLKAAEFLILWRSVFGSSSGRRGVLPSRRCCHSLRVAPLAARS